MEVGNEAPPSLVGNSVVPTLQHEDVEMDSVNHANSSIFFMVESAFVYLQIDVFNYYDGVEKPVLARNPSVDQAYHVVVLLVVPTMGKRMVFDAIFITNYV